MQPAARVVHSPAYHEESKVLTSSLDKKTWWGCGQHVPTVMDKVAEEDRCTCTPKVEKGGKEYVCL